MYELCLGDEPVTGVIDRITARACDAAPGLDRDACRRLVALIFTVRVRRTHACGTDPACRPTATGWRGGAAPGRPTAGWLDLDPLALPAMFAASAADLVAPPPAAEERTALEVRLAAAFRAVIRSVVFANPSCGRAAVCNAEPVFDDLSAQIEGDPDRPDRA